MALQATVVKCPECGASLKVAEGAANATCSYCNTESRVQRRTQFLGMKMRLPPAAADQPVRIAHAQRTIGAAIVLGIILLCGIGIPVAVVGALIAAKMGTFDGVSWASAGAPVVVDCDGDGTDDFVGWDHNTRTNTAKLAAFSGVDGKLLWETDALGKYDDVSHGVIATGGGVVVVADKNLGLTGYDGKTGAKKWSATTTDAVDAACGLVLHTADNKVVAVTADGKLAPSTQTCERGWRDVPGATELASRDRKAVDGMATDKIYARGDGPRIAVGGKHPGTPIAMVAALDAGGATLWSAVVPGHDPRDAKHGVDHLAISDDAVAIAYERSGKTLPEVTVFDRATGKRRFETALTKTFFNVLSGVAITRTAVAVSSWGSLQVFDLKTGALKFTVGD